MLTVGATLGHILVFVYWLGGDLGAFYASTILTDPRQPAPARLAAARVLNRVDLAPNTALILALPTGLSLALVQGWLAFNPDFLIPIWLVALLSVAISWHLHLSIRPNPLLSRIDLLVRWIMITLLVTAGAAGVFRVVAMPWFLAVKLLILAGCTWLGLLVRLFLTEFGPAFAELVQGRASPESDAVIARSLARCRVAVIGIWALLLAAASLGIAKPG